MSKLKKKIVLETAFGTYTVDELLGEGGAGRVYGGISPDGAMLALKVLSNNRATTDKRRRFKNEISFLARNKHPNIVSVIDHGVAKSEGLIGPFYVMQRYDCNLREIMRSSLSPQEVLQIFVQIMDGVEAAHLQSVVHRDLKPENILFDRGTRTPAVADFGVASFTDDLIATTVETGPTQRLANFMYAAPEQRVPGRQIGPQADIYALGLMLNEMYTNNVPHGTEYQPIAKASTEFGFLDAVVSLMIRQAPNERYASIADVKRAISLHHSEFLTVQKLSKIDATVIPQGAVDDPLAHEPPKLIDADWNNGILELRLDRPVHELWVHALHNMRSYTSAMGVEPTRFQFSGAVAKVMAPSRIVQQVIDYFKEWLPQATRILNEHLQNEARLKEHQQREKLKAERAAEEERLKVISTIKI